MKKFLKRGLSICLALTLAIPHVFASDALGSDLKGNTVRLGTGTTVTDNSFWSATYSDLRTEKYITYTPNQTVTPVVWYGSTVPTTERLSDAAAALSRQGYRVLAGVNGGFYNTDGTAVGLIITDGVIRSLDKDNYCMVGFDANGGVFIDNSDIAKTVSWGGFLGSQATTLEVAAINESRGNGGLYLFTEDFGTSMKNTLKGVDVVLEPLIAGQNLKMNSSTIYRVVSVTDSTAEGVAASNAIPAGCLVLSANENCDPSILNHLRSLSVGTQVTLNITGGDSRWANAVYGVSGLYSLVENGQTVSGLPSGAAPRTAIGVRADGSVVFYTIDGRQSGYSVGASYTQVAQRLIELGCVQAVALDGGGSTTIGATMPGDTGFTVLNKPSGGSERKVSNCILLVTAAPATGMMDQIYVKTGSDVILTGGTTLVGARPADANGYPASAGGTLNWNASGGTFCYDEEGNTLFAAGGQAGLYEVTATAAGRTGTATVRVIDQLSELEVIRTDFGTEAESLILSPGDVVDLDAEGTWYNIPVGMDDTMVSWSSEGAIGEIDGNGVFTAGLENGVGTVTASVGGRTVTMEVKVDRGDPFTDVATHWAQPYITRLYKMGLTTGTLLEDGTYIYQPDSSLTRGQLLVFLCRMLGVDTAQYEGVELPFADLDSIEEWVLPSVKAMYALQVFSGTLESGMLYGNVNGLVTREAAMTMLGRVLAQQQSYDLSVFVDGNKVSDWAAPYVQTLVAQGIVSGSEGLLNPQKNMTRAEIAKVLTMVNDLPRAELTPRG